METVLNEIEKALAAKLYYIALMLTFALPDICAALEAEDGRTSRGRYKAWYEKNLAPKFSFLSSDDCYSLRCGVVHQGRFGIAGSDYARAVFVLPGTGKPVFDDCKMGDAFVSNADVFCRNVIQSIREWFAVAQDTDNVKKNLPQLIRVHPEGFAPYIVGMPLIA